jgi:hypothetical protein
MADITANGLLNKLGRITSELVQFQKELTTVEITRHETYSNIWQTSSAETVAQRNREAEFSVTDLDTVIIEIKGKLKSLENEYRYYELYLTNVDRVNSNGVQGNNS